MNLVSKNSKLVDSAGLSLLTNKSPSQISLLGSNSSIGNKSPSQISLLGSNSSISSLSRSNASIPEAKNAYPYQSNIRNSPLADRARSPYGSPNLSDRSKSPYLQGLDRSKSPYGSPIFEKTKNYGKLEMSKSPVEKSKSPYGSPNLGNRDAAKSPGVKNGDYSSLSLDRSGKAEKNYPGYAGLSVSMTSSQLCDEKPAEKPLFSTLPRQRSIPTIIGMPRRLQEQRKSLPQVPSRSEEFNGKAEPPPRSESKNPFEKLEGFTVPANPTGKNPFLDEAEEGYNYENVASRVISFEQKTGNGDNAKGNPYVGVHTAQNAMYQTTIGQYGTVVTTNVGQMHAASMSSLQYSVPVSSGTAPRAPQPAAHPPQYAGQYKTPVPHPRKEQKPGYDSGKLGFEQMKASAIREEISETPTPSSSTGTDSSRKDMGQEGDVESDADEVAEQADMVPELGSKLF